MAPYSRLLKPSWFPKHDGERLPVPTPTRNFLAPCRRPTCCWRWNRQGVFKDQYRMASGVEDMIPDAGFPGGL